MNIKEDKEQVKGFLTSIGECIGVLTAYFMVFYFLWEGVLAAAGAK